MALLGIGNDNYNDNDNNADDRVPVQVQDQGLDAGPVHVQSRRRMISSIAAGVLTSGLVTRHLKHAFAEYAYANVNANAATIPASTSTTVQQQVQQQATAFGTADHPVAIVGGSGRTGMAVAESLADPAFGNMHAVTLSRSGKDPFQIVKLPQSTRDHLKHKSEPFDVRESPETVLANLRAVSPSVVVYAASASRQGGNAFDVDDRGVEKVAAACKELGALFVLVSALAVDRPDSKSYQITNTLGGNYQGIMDAKYNGETKTRAIGGDYVIVRPGVLLSGKSTTGPSGIELNQGDTIGGGLSRDELAGVVVGAIQSRALQQQQQKTAKKTEGNKGTGITVEAYRRSTAQKLEKKYEMPSGNELTVDADASLAANANANTNTPASSSRTLYRELFARAKPDQIV